MSKITAEELDSFTIGEGLDIPEFNDDQQDDELAMMAAQIQEPKSIREILAGRLTPQQVNEALRIHRKGEEGAKSLHQAGLNYQANLGGVGASDGKASPEIMEGILVEDVKKVLEAEKKRAKKGGKRRKTKKRRKSRKRKTKKRRRKKKRKTKKRYRNQRGCKR